MNAGKALGSLVVLFVLSMGCLLTFLCGLLTGGTIGFLAGGAAGYAGGSGFRPQQPRLQFPLPVPTEIAPRLVPRPITPTPAPQSPAPRLTPVPQPTPQMPPAALPFGQTGARLLTVAPDGPAGKAGLRVGDIIFAVNGTPIGANHLLSDVIRSFKPGEIVSIELFRAGAKLAVNVMLGSQALPDGRTAAFLDVRYDLWPPPGRAN